MLAAAFAGAAVVAATARRGDDGVIFFAVEGAGTGEFFDGVDGDEAFDEDFEEFDEEAEFLDRDERGRRIPRRGAAP